MNTLDNILNLSTDETSKFSLSTALLAFYLIISTNFIGDLFSGQMQDFFKNNRTVKHILGLTSMLTVIILTAGVVSMKKVFIYSIIGYFWFLLTTKLNINWNMAILALLILGFLHESNVMKKEMSASTDQALTDADREKIKRRHNRTKTVIIIAIMIITLLGTLEYYLQKKAKYKDDFSMIKFICDGRGVCRVVKVED